MKLTDSLAITSLIAVAYGLGDSINLTSSALSCEPTHGHGDSIPLSSSADGCTSTWNLENVDFPTSISFPSGITINFTLSIPDFDTTSSENTGTTTPGYPGNTTTTNFIITSVPFSETRTDFETFSIITATGHPNGTVPSPTSHADISPTSFDSVATEWTPITWTPITFTTITRG
ncbi:hypothetical protein MGN70_006262 [Eutypa lata]|nr:hypothetical protein MGN70_006262 [Eutypa lata]